MPGKPVRVRWRREEEFGFEPVSPAMVVTVRAALDDAGKPGRLDAPRSGAARIPSRPGGGGNLLAAEALPDPPPAPPPTDVPEADGGGGTRNGEPLYDIAGQAHRASSGRRDAGAHLVAARARRDAQRVRDRMRHRRTGRARRRGPGRLSAVDHRRSARARRDREGRRAWRAGKPTRRAAPASGRGIALRPLQEPRRLRRRRRRGRGRRGASA